MVILPRWVGLVDVPLVVATLASAGTWAALEFRWSNYRLRSPLAVEEE
jgi:hypothetical protein